MGAPSSRRGRATTHILLASAIALSSATAIALAGCTRTPSAPPAAETVAAIPERVIATGTAPPAVSEPPTPPAAPTPAPRPVVATETDAPSDNTTRGWGFTRNKTHTTPDIAAKDRKLLERYGGVYVGDTHEKVVYLTFDEGYENGDTPRILDTLADEDVKATFFVTGTYCRDSPEECRRMVDEGHLVGSHSWSHPSMPSKAETPTAFVREFTKTADAFEKATGTRIARYFRPPSGQFSALSLWRTRELGYLTVFWSFAHVDYDENAQPPVDVTVERVLAGSHPGAIILLHAISTSDTEALPRIISGLREQGYRFATLDELPR